MLFNEDDYGTYITKEISDVLRRYVGRLEFREAAERASEQFKRISASTVRDVCFGTNAITENNSHAMNIRVGS